MKRLFPLFISVLATLFVFSICTSAATLMVTKAANSNDGACDADCSLREAVAAANPNDTVRFNPNLIGQTFVLGGSQIVVNKTLTIDGDIDGVNVAFISGSNTSRHFLLTNSIRLTIRNAILAQGNSDAFDSFGGSIQTGNGSSLTLDRVAIRGNTAEWAGALYLFGAGDHIITNSSITGNTSERIPAIFVTTQSSLYMSNTTVSGNRNIVDNASSWGAITIMSAQQVVIRNCTIATNEANRGGGLYVEGTGTFNVANTIVGANSSANGAQDIHYVAGTLNSSGGNLVQNMATVPGGIFNQTKDITGQNPRVAPTNSNQGGHPLFTHPLQSGSPAIGGGINSVAVEPFSNTPLTTDARGVGFPRTFGTSVDKGAFEDQTNSASLYVSKLADTNDGTCDHDCSLREAVAAAAADAGTDNITMAANVFGTITVGSEISIQNQNVTITGYPSLNSETLIVSGGDARRVFNVSNFSSVTMTGFTIADGNGAGASVPFGGGGMLASDSTIILDRMIFRDNVSPNYGGGLAIYSGVVVRIMNSTIAGNSAENDLGAYIDAGVTYITNTTISSNVDSNGGDASGALSINGTLYMRNSTIAANRSSDSTNGAGLYCNSSTTLNLGNNVIASNLAASNPDLHVTPGGTLQSVGGNLIGSLTGYNNAIFVAPDDQLGVSALLLPLANNGGNVPTHGLGMGSPAMNTGWNAAATDPFSAQALANDARGTGYTRIVGPRVDKGAFESLVPTAASVNIGGRILSGEGGKPIANVVVVLTGPNGVVGSQVTGHLGYYQFNDVEVGHNYIVSVQSKRFSFEPRIVNLTEEILDLDLVATH